MSIIHDPLDRYANPSASDREVCPFCTPKRSEARQAVWLRTCYGCARRLMPKPMLNGCG